MKTKRFDDVWDAIEATPAKAANMRARADLMIAIHKAVSEWDVTQASAAKRLGLTATPNERFDARAYQQIQPRRLISVPAGAGLAVRVHVRRTAA
jgi:predicted XRE-type DNA-binding protein